MPKMDVSPQLPQENSRFGEVNKIFTNLMARTVKAGKVGIALLLCARASLVTRCANRS